MNMRENENIDVIMNTQGKICGRGGRVAGRSHLAQCKDPPAAALTTGL